MNIYTKIHRNKKDAFADLFLVVQYGKTLDTTNDKVSTQLSLRLWFTGFKMNILLPLENLLMYCRITPVSRAQ